MMGFVHYFFLTYFSRNYAFKQLLKKIVVDLISTFIKKDR